MSQMQLKDLHDKASTLAEQSRQILEAANREKRDLTSEEQDRWELMHEERDRLMSLSQRLVKQMDVEKSEIEGLAEKRSKEREQAKLNLDPELRRVVQRSAFDKWMRGGTSHLNVEERQALSGLHPGDEFRAQAIGTDGAGGYLVPEDFQRELEVALTDYVGVLKSRARVIRTSTGAALPWPSYDDTAEAGEIISENSQVDTTNHDITFTSTTLNAYMYSSNGILISYQLLQDNAFDLDAEMRRALATRLGRILNTHTTTGTGSSQPNGVVTAAADSEVDFPLAGVPTYANLLDVFHAVDPAYRQNAEWMFHDDFLKEVRQVEEPGASERLIWQPSAAPGAPDTLLGKPYIINQGMPAPGSANNKSCLFGDFSKYIVRLVTPSTVMRLNERYADYLQVGFLGYMRMDADLIDAGTNPIVYGAEAAA